MSWLAPWVVQLACVVSAVIHVAFEECYEEFVQIGDFAPERTVEPPASIPKPRGRSTGVSPTFSEYLRKNGSFRKIASDFAEVAAIPS
jgi:hypothetical protein